MNRSTKIICELYKNFVRQKPCLACLTSPVDFDHLVARGRGEGKRNDFTGIPLCRRCHSERGQIGDGKFQDKWKVNLWQENAWLLIEFFAYSPAIAKVLQIKFGKGDKQWNPPA